MYILFPGRHHLLTKFQHQYLLELVEAADPPIESVIFAVTSANHSLTRRNPLPLHLRAMALHSFGVTLPVPSFIYDIDDVGVLPDFANYVLRRVETRSSGRFKLTPENTEVLCSTPSVIALYEELGFKILPAELSDLDGERETYHAMLPWETVEAAVAGDDEVFGASAHQATTLLWERYEILPLLRTLFNDRLIGDDGDLTETRDYNTYVRQMDENIPAKYAETAAYLRPGRIGDIGCAVGSWIRHAAADPRLSESEFYGVEVSRKLYSLCEQRKANGDFANPFVFFSRKNAVTGTVFEVGTMHTIHTSSLTHEIYSYVPDDCEDAAATGLAQLRQFIENRYRELLDGGVWVNRDVIGPEEPERIVLMAVEDRERFLRFAKDYRRAEGECVSFEEVDQNGELYFKLRLADAWEFATKKDYLQNWESEMHERFCYWSESDWRGELEAVGFRILEGSGSYLNAWIEENRLVGEVTFIDADTMRPLPYPPTTVVLIAEKV